MDDRLIGPAIAGQSSAGAPPRVNLAPYDAVVLVSFGGPERREDVVPFLENVTRGRGIPRERLVEVGQHYFAFGGRSPINDQCRALRAALSAALAEEGCDLPVYWGNRNWHPLLGDELQRLVAAGHRRVLAVTTSAYPSYSSCRQYREDLYQASLDLPLQVDRVRQYANHPGFVAASVDATLAALSGLPESGRRESGLAESAGRLGGASGSTRLVFVTHAIPTTMAETSGPTGDGYVRWHAAVAAEVVRQVAERTGTSYEHDLVYCSRSGPPGQPWLEPDVNDHLEALAAAKVPAVVLVPIGFVSDHMEVIYDLDTEAAATAAALGLPFARAATAGTDRRFVAALVDILAERAAVARDDAAGDLAGSPAVIAGAEPGLIHCPAHCCPNLRHPERPALDDQPWVASQRSTATARP